MSTAAPDGEDAGRDVDVRTCVLAVVTGLLCGALAAAFRAGLAAAERLHAELIAGLAPVPDPGWLLLVVAAAAGASVAGWLTFRFAPEAAGSGIPQVEERLEDGVPVRWRRVLPVKFAGGMLALGSGLSMGREGPTVQMGGALADALARAAGAGPETVRTLLAAGAGAGLAAAFDAPLAGVVFVVEELRRPQVPRTWAAALLAALAANAVLRATATDRPIFDLPGAPPMSAVLLAWCVVVGVVAGVAGVAFNRVLASALALADRSRWPPWARGTAAGGLAGLLACVLPAVIADGEPVAERILRAQLPADGATGWLLGVAAGKLGLTVASYAAGAPGGIFAPLLVMGAALGAAIATVAGSSGAGAAVPALAMAGMTAMFVAVVRVPLTGIVLITEMTGAGTHVFGLALATVTALLVANGLREPPVYDALRARDRRRTAAARAGRTGPDTV